MKEKLKAPFFTIIMLLAAITLFIVDHFSMSAYFIFTAFYLLLMNSLCSNKRPDKTTHQQAITTYLGVSLLSFLVFYNYYQAKDDAYSNLDHHALEWKGYQLPESGVLYGQGTDAFLQDTASVGNIRYELQRGDTGQVTAIHLTAHDLRRSFFAGERGSSDGIASSYKNKNTTLPVVPSEGICFENQAHETRLRLQIVELPQTTYWPMGGPERDSVRYIFTVTNLNDSLLCTDTVSNTLLIQKSYDLSALIPIQTVSVFGNNLSHFNIVRQRYRTAESPYKLSNYGWLKRALVVVADNLPVMRKEFCSFRDQDYLIEQTQTDDDVTIVNDNEANHFFETTIRPGDPFFLGFGEGSTPRMYFSRRGQLCFDLPQWRPLLAEGEQTRMLVSSSNHVICNPDDVSPCNLLFQAPHVDTSDGEPAYQGNDHIFTTSVSYAKGPTSEQLRLCIEQDRVVKAGEEFLVECQRANANAQAVLQLTDFKQKSYYQPWPFFRTIIILFIIASLSILISIRYLHNHAQPINIEMACMVLFMVLFTVRYILCWRMSVFPPLEDLSRLEYERFVNSASVYSHLTFVLPLAFLLLPACKLFALIHRIWCQKKELNATESMTMQPTATEKPQKKWWLWFPLLIVFVEAMLCIALPRGFQILLPVASYFLLDVLLTKYAMEEADDEHPWRGLNYCFSFPFVLNYVVHLGLLTMLDAGFGVMFLLFGVVRYYLMWCRYSQHLKEFKSRSWLWWIMTVGGIAAILALFFFSTNFVASMMNSPWLGTAVITLAIALVLLLFAWGIDTSLNHRFWQRPAYRGITVAGCLLVGWLIASPSYDYVLGPDGHYTHLRYRTKVLVEEWKDILNNERVGNASNVQRFRQTSENQWILDHYYNNRPKGQERYFQMQPMSRTGAMWGAQTTDLSFLRFGIGEHGMSFAVGLLLLMLLVYAIAMRQPHDPQFARREARRSIALGALLLILMQGIFVWMSVTNKFIFFGQDFPMLSMTSKMTIYYVLFLLMVAILCAVPHPKEAAKMPVFNRNELRLSWLFTGILAVFCLFLHYVQGMDRENRDIDRYSLELNSVKKVLHAHNSLLYYYQLQSNQAYNRLVLSTQGGYNSYGKKLFSDFNQNVYLNLDDEHEGISSPDCIIALGEEEGTTQFPLIASSSNLSQPLLDLYRLQRRPSSARMVMSPDSVTLQFVFPQDSVYTPQERSLIQKINELFISYQIENRSLHLANLFVGRRFLAQKKAVRTENDSTLRASRRMLNSSDFTGMMLDYQAFLDSARQHQGQPQNARLDTLLARIDNIDNIEGATFTNSLIEAYMHNYAKNNSPGNIVYMRRNRTTGYLQFHINDQFFKIDDGQRLWRGDIVACDAEVNNLLYIRSDGQRVTGNREHNDHFDEVCIPSSWLMGEKDQYLFQAHAPITLRLKANTPIPLPYHQWSALRLSNADGASVIETEGQVSVKLPDDLYNVFAKNVMVNGKRRQIYRLGKKLFWMKPYCDYVNSVMADSIRDNHPESMAFNHVVSLDFGLSDTLYQFIDSLGHEIFIHETDNKLKQTNFSVFVGNSEGEILAMPEYNGNPVFRVNPNDQQSIRQFQLQSNLFSDYTDERNLNGNQNLLPLAIGPGSSLKPLTFGAVSSTFTTNWNQFGLIGVLANQAVHHYAERDFNRTEKDFVSDWRDEPAFGTSFDVANYLIRSSNYFNSTMVYIGSFSEASLQNGILTPASTTLTEREFPVMSIGGHRMKFMRDRIFRPQDVDAQSILKLRYRDNYGVYSEPMLLDSTYLDQNSLDPPLRSYSRQLSRNKGKKSWIWPAEAWSVPEPSFIDFPLWADDAELSYAQKIKTLTLGMRRVVSISPLKMAEMYARMFLLDNRFHFTVNQAEPYQSSVNHVLPAYDNEPASYLAILQEPHSFFQGMKHCAMNDNTEDGVFYRHGTAYYLNSIGAAQREKGRYIYAKTGTIDNNNNNQANMLAVIITNADMRHVTIINNRMVTPDGSPLKFYVIYMAQDKTLARSWGRKQYLYNRPSIKEVFQTGVVRKVVNSSRFRKFFENNTNQQ